MATKSPGKIDGPMPAGGACCIAGGKDKAMRRHICCYVGDSEIRGRRWWVPDSESTRCLERNLTPLAADNELQIVINEGPEAKDWQSQAIENPHSSYQADG